MIRIKKSNNADTRTANHKVSKDELLIQSRIHINDVVRVMGWMVKELINQSYEHDWTKITYIDEFYHDFKQSQDGFQGDFKQQHWFKNLHLLERHHLNDRCPDSVNLFDVLERIANCVTAGMARSGSVYEEDVSPDMLIKAYKNTMKLLIDEITVEE